MNPRPQNAHPDASDRPRRRRGLGRAGPVALFATIVPIVGQVLMVSAAPFIAVGFRGSGVGGWVIFVSAFALLGALTLAPTYTTSIVAGWAFGFRAGFAAVMVGTVTGAIFCYLLARRLAAARVAESFGQHPKWEIVRAALVDGRRVRTLWIVFLLRLSPVLPFGTTNVLMATTRVPLPIYVAGTLLGLAPRVALVAIAASGAENLDLKQKQSWVILVVGLLATAACIFVLALIGRRALHRATMATPAEAPARPHGP